MTAFGCVPRASVWPWARCVEAKTSPSSSAWHTPTATASWPIATCRKPGSSPARKRSSTFSSKRLIRSISRRKVRTRSSLSVDFRSTFAICFEFMLRLVSVVDQWQAIERYLPEGWGDARLRLTIPDLGDCDRAAALLGPVNPGRRGKVIPFFTARRGAGPSPDVIRRLLAGLDRAEIDGQLVLLAASEAEGAAPPVEARPFVPAWEAELAPLAVDWRNRSAGNQPELTDSRDPA